jgi:hypothetical protein
VHLEVALLQLILHVTREALTVTLVFHNLLMSLEILRMLLIYLGVMLITESPIGIHAAVQVRTQVPERVCKDSHILRRQETFRGLGSGALET